MLTTSRTRLLAGAATLALTASLGASSALAETDTGTLTVSAQVNQSCSLGTINPLDFEVITPGATEEANTTFEVICSISGDVSISMSGHDGGFWTMENGDSNSTIDYKLFDAGDFSGASLWDEPKTKTVSGNDQIDSFGVWGQISGSHSAGATDGLYQDQVTITVTF